jgi:hypothetical protein
LCIDGKKKRKKKKEKGKKLNYLIEKTQYGAEIPDFLSKILSPHRTTDDSSHYYSLIDTETADRRHV